MIVGLSLADLSQRLIDDARAHRDFVADTRTLEAGVADGKPVVQFSAGSEQLVVAPTQHALRQIGTHTDIPAKYLDRMAAEAPELLAANINHWFRANAAPRMLRTKLNGSSTLRAFLSNKYRPLDNVDLANAVLPELLAPGWHVVSAQITEARFYIQAVSNKLEAQVKHAQRTGRKGDVLQPGVVISNSEIGHGRLDVASMILTLSCLNGMISGSALRRNHVGRANGGGRDDEDAWELFSDEARQADDRALWLKVRDTVRSAVDERLFFRLVEKLNVATGDAIDDPASTVEVTAKRFGLSEDEQHSVLEHLARGGDLTRYGLLNAVTRTAEDATSYDRAIELERVGGEILELPASALLRLN
ncbi:MAG: hypothetical protein WAN59_03510 [Candidatus Baltobacteraceae bacterium]